MSFYTYIIYSKSRDRYYTGSCSNLKKRLQRHNDGATPSTKTGKPWEIYWFEEFENRSDAIKREYQIKKMKSRKYIENLRGSSAGPEFYDFSKIG